MTNILLIMLIAMVAVDIIWNWRRSGRSKAGFQYFFSRDKNIMKTIQDLTDAVGNLEIEVGNLKPKPEADVTPLFDRVTAVTESVAAFNAANNPPAPIPADNGSTSTDTPGTPIIAP